MPLWLPLKSDPPSIDERLLLGLGRAIMYWAWFEHHLLSDIMALQKIAKHSGMADMVSLGIPPTFNKRLKLWGELSRTCYANIPHYLERAEAIRNGAVTLSRVRNLLIHGFLEGHTPRDDGSVTLTNMMHRKGHAQFSQHTLTVSALEEFNGNMVRVNDEIMSLSMNRTMGTHRAADQQSEPPKA
jgi:hypothetical protein